MNFRNSIYLTVLFCLLIKSLFAQQYNKGFDDVYGMDPELYNGQIYKYYVNTDTKGTQFLSGPEFILGTVRIKGITYPDVKLNYDVYNQQLLLESPNSIYTNTILILSETWLEGFSLGSAVFEVVRFQDTSRRICQVYGNGSHRILTFWTKEQKYGYEYAAPYLIFSTPKKEMYLQSGNAITRFKNNRSFISGFDKPSQAAISKYIHQHKVKVKKAGSDTLNTLITFCNTQTK
jgi:hypothetical protein